MQYLLDTKNILHIFSNEESLISMKHIKEERVLKIVLSLK